MSERLQVLLDEEEFARVREDARRHGMNVSEWVRRSLRDARRQRAEGSTKARLQAIERALACEHPTGDIDELLDEVEAGRAL